VATLSGLDCTADVMFYVRGYYLTERNIKCLGKKYGCCSWNKCWPLIRKNRLWNWIWTDFMTQSFNGVSDISVRNRRWRLNLCARFGIVRIATGWKVRGTVSLEDEIFRTRPDRPWGPPNFLYQRFSNCGPRTTSGPRVLPLWSF